MAIPSLEAVEESFRQAEVARHFWETHYQELLEKHPEEFVAVHNRLVVAANRDLLELIHDLKAKDLDPQSVWIRFITTNPRRFLL